MIQSGFIVLLFKWMFIRSIVVIFYNRTQLSLNDAFGDALMINLKHVHSFNKLLLLTVFIIPTFVQAAFVTTNEVEMEAIYQQQPFSLPIDIRFNPVITLANSTYLNISDAATLTALFNEEPFPRAVTSVNMYFIDSLSYCGRFDTSFLGCANRPGNDIVVESNAAAGPNGAELNAHELGHSLGLMHEDDFGNLMNSTINGDTSLLIDQVRTILGSPLMQLAGGGITGPRFIEITPILITPVPLPASLWFAISGFASLGMLRKRKYG